MFEGEAVTTLSDMTGISQRVEESGLIVITGLSFFKAVPELSLVVEVVCSPTKVLLLDLSILEGGHAVLRLLDIVGILLSIAIFPFPPLPLLEGAGSLEAGDVFWPFLDESKGPGLSLYWYLLECP